MAAGVKFQAWSENVLKGVNFTSDTFKVCLSNSLPDSATYDFFNDLTEIAAGNGYTAGGGTTTISLSRTGGTTKVIGTDVNFVASGGTIGPFRYAILYKSTGVGSTSPLIGYWDYSVSITLNAGENFLVDFDATNGIIQSS